MADRSLPWKVHRSLSSHDKAKWSPRTTLNFNWLWFGEWAWWWVVLVASLGACNGKWAGPEMGEAKWGLALKYAWPIGRVGPVLSWWRGKWSGTVNSYLLVLCLFSCWFNYFFPIIKSGVLFLNSATFPQTWLKKNISDLLLGFYPHLDVDTTCFVWSR